MKVAIKQPNWSSQPSLWLLAGGWMVTEPSLLSLFSPFYSPGNTQDVTDWWLHSRARNTVRKTLWCWTSDLSIVIRDRVTTRWGLTWVYGAFPSLKRINCSKKVGPLVLAAFLVGWRHGIGQGMWGIACFGGMTWVTWKAIFAFAIRYVSFYNISHGHIFKFSSLKSHWNLQWVGLVIRKILQR